MSNYPLTMDDYDEPRYHEPSCFEVSEGDEVTAHDELVRELADFDGRISDLEVKLSKALDNIDLLGQAVAALIQKVDPNFTPNQQ
jgi:hypothetical protein